MPRHAIEGWTHPHAFHVPSGAAERGTRIVLWITLATMALEIGAGWWSGSMALLADGWHMGSHALAIGLAAFAYTASRRLAGDDRFAFGTWKIEVLAAFASALLLLVVAALMALGSAERLLRPEPIAYREAIAVAALGLVVNVVCAAVLGRAGEGHGHGHVHRHGGGAHAHDGARDLNLRSAYVHVLADAATSVLAIAALAGGLAFGWRWLDPAIGAVGAVLIAVWSKGLLAETTRVLLDREMDAPVVAGIRAAVATGPDAGDTRIADLHVWRVGRDAFACAIVLVTHDASLTADAVREKLAVHPEVVHATVEIHRCCP